MPMQVRLRFVVVFALLSMTTAPVVAATYYRDLAPVGLLMGVFGYLIGTYAGLLCAFLLNLVA